MFSGLKPLSNPPRNSLPARAAARARPASGVRENPRRRQSASVAAVGAGLLIDELAHGFLAARRWSAAVSACRSNGCSTSESPLQDRCNFRAAPSFSQAPLLNGAQRIFMAWSVFTIFWAHHAESVVGLFSLHSQMHHGSISSIRLQVLAALFALRCFDMRRHAAAPVTRAFSASAASSWSLHRSSSSTGSSSSGFGRCSSAGTA